VDAFAERPVELLVLRGSLDVATAADVRQALHAALDGGTGDLVVDLAGVVLLDATGLGVLVGAHRRSGSSACWWQRGCTGCCKSSGHPSRWPDA